MSDETVQRLKRVLWRDDLLLPFLEEVLPELGGDALLRAAELVHDGVAASGRSFRVSTQGPLSDVAAGSTNSLTVNFPVNEGGGTEFLCWSLSIRATPDPGDSTASLYQASGRPFFEDVPVAEFSPRGRLVHRFPPSGLARISFTNRTPGTVLFVATFEGIQREGANERVAWMENATVREMHELRRIMNRCGERGARP